MQSSLFKFLSREEGRQTKSTKRACPADNELNHTPKKKLKLEEQLKGSFEKLKHFARITEPSSDHDVMTGTGELSKAPPTLGELSKAPPTLGGPSKAPPTLGGPSKAPPTLGGPSKAPPTSGGPSKAPPTVCDLDMSRGSVSRQYTPLEEQFIAIKAQYPDAILFVECGYKYRFFGVDAEIASKVLNIGCFPDHNFHTASIPVHRLNVHLRRLVAAGYKVGVVKQTETAALKAASDKKSGPFSRELSALYTRTTLIGGDVDSHQGATDDDQLFMMCLYEQREGSDRQRNTTIGFLAVQPAAGNMVYDEFEDNLTSLSELEMRLAHIKPAEVLVPRKLSKQLVNVLTEWKRHSGIEGLRTEELPDDWFEYSKAFPTVTEFYGMSSNSKTDKGFQVVLDLPSTSLCCLGALVRYLKSFRLENVLCLTSNLKPFSSGGGWMRLNSRTLENLEIFRNQTDKTDRGSLFWVLNHTSTLFGKRMLTTWLSHPLTDVRMIRQRQEAVTELTSMDCPSVSLLKDCLAHVPDLEKMLCSTYHKKCSPSEFYSLVRSFARIHNQFESFTEMALTDLKSELLQQILKELPVLLGDAHHFQEALNEQAARDCSYEELFTDPKKFSQVAQEKEMIAEVKQKLADCRKQFRKTLSNYSLDYVNVSGAQYLVEVKNKDINKVPMDWIRVSGYKLTKQVTRFHPPYVLQAVKLLAQHNDQLKIAAKAAWDEFLNDFNVGYASYKRAVYVLATCDCLLSLAKVARLPGYVCPSVSEEQIVDIESGRHPIIEHLFEDEQFVPNDAHLKSHTLRTMIITGPNMGGKSSYIKQVGLICIMAQIGCYVPATAATVGVLDAIHTRMGARDSLHSGNSTFMLELTETSEVIKLATSKSLVILDELGRGTSTHDGTAIAYATLNYFIEQVKCFTLFVTHYPLLAELEWKCCDGTVGNFHMAYVQQEDSDADFEKIVFLYQLEKQVASGSYGLNVASLAGLDNSILKSAQRKSNEMKFKGFKVKSQADLLKKTFLKYHNSKDLTQSLLI